MTISVNADGIRRAMNDAWFEPEFCCHYLHACIKKKKEKKR